MLMFNSISQINKKASKRNKRQKFYVVYWVVVCTHLTEPPSTKPFFYLYINWREGCRMMKCGATWLRYPSWQQVVVFPVTSTEGRSFEISVASLLIHILRSDKFQKLAGLKMYLPWKWSVWSNICTQELGFLFDFRISECDSSEKMALDLL
jgi:hypothetical protein